MKRIKPIIFWALSVVIGFVLLEGICSVMIALQSLRILRPIPERMSTRYDEELGWVSVPNVFVKDIFGPGIDLRTNAQAFRGSEDITTKVPDGKVRVICSGDSMTLGLGVGDDQTWVHLLSKRDSRLQMVNMGQAGYGVDQAYLWYMRDGRQYQHSVHIFAFILDDLERLRWPTFMGYGKPILKLVNNHLITTNTPVPRRGYLVPWITTNVGVLDGFRLVQFLKSCVSSLYKNKAGMNVVDAGQILSQVFKSLSDANQTDHSELILLRLPTIDECLVGKSTNQDLKNRALELLVQDTKSTQTHFIDLTDDFQKVPASDIRSLFLVKNQPGIVFVAGHYSAKGHEFIANSLYTRLLHILR